MVLKKKSHETQIKVLEMKNNRRLANEQVQKELDKPLACNKDTFVCLKNIQKIYPNGFQSVYDFNLDIKEGEFIVFVGPSGCGKSTTLRMVCGLEDITAGALFINNIYSNDLPPSDRGISMVFQNYALFPHLSVYENIAYGIKIRKYLLPKYDKEGNHVVGIDERAIKELEKEKTWILKNDPDNLEDLAKIDHDIEQYKNNEIPLYVHRKFNKKEVNEKVQKTAKILNLEELLQRKPGQLSGGQCQRVALGRVIVSDAKLLLMDEPLSNLDAKLRVTMRSEIIDLHKKLGATTIYVTHDQVEAMTMSDRLVVMNKGKIVQVGTPEEVYNHPNSLFVASFIGSPTMNFLTSSLENEVVKVGNLELKLKKEELNKINLFYKEELDNLNKEINELSMKYQDILLENKKEELINIKTSFEESINNKYDLVLGVRPENIKIADEKSKIKLSALVESYELLGLEYHVFIRVNNEKIMMILPATEKLNINEEIDITFDMDNIHLFDKLSTKNISL